MAQEREITIDERVVSIADCQWDDDETVSFAMECWFDVDKYFGTNTKDEDDTWINFYVMWNRVTDVISAIYFIDTNGSSEQYDWPLTVDEEKMFRKMMEEYVKMPLPCLAVEDFGDELVPERSISASLICDFFGFNFYINCKDNETTEFVDDDGVEHKYEIDDALDDYHWAFVDNLEDIGNPSFFGGHTEERVNDWLESHYDFKYDQRFNKSYYEQALAWYIMKEPNALVTQLYDVLLAFIHPEYITEE